MVYFPPFVSESIIFVPSNYKGIIKSLLLEIRVDGNSPRDKVLPWNVLEKVEKLSLSRYEMIVASGERKLEN